MVHSITRVKAITDPLEEVIKETRHAFIIAKADGILEAGEVVQIAVDVARKLQKFLGLSGAEKKAVVLLTLKKGLDSAGGVSSLPGLKEATPEMQEIFEKQLLSAASAALDVVVAVAAGKIDLRKPASWKACLPACVSLAKGALVLLPKDQVILKEALEFATSALPVEQIEESPLFEKAIELPVAVPSAAHAAHAAHAAESSESSPQTAHADAVGLESIETIQPTSPEQIYMSLHSPVEESSSAAPEPPKEEAPQ